MSLLNQVLQDLDDRSPPEARHPVRLAVAPEAVVYTDDLEESGGRDWVRIGTWMAVGAAVMLAAWVFHDGDRDAREVSAVQVAAPAGSTPVSQSQPRPLQDPEPPVVSKSLAVTEDALPANPPAAQTPLGSNADSATIDAIPESRFENEGNPTEARPAQTVAVAEDGFLPLRNTELPAAQKNRSDKVRRKTSLSSSVKTAKKSVPQPLEQVREAIDEGELATAEHLLQQRLAVAPKDREARELLIGLMLRGERYDAAGRQLDQALSLHPGHSKFVLIKARLLAQDGEVDAAVRILQAMPASSPGSVERLQMLGALYQQQSRYEDALGSYRTLLELTPDSGPVWVGVAISLDGLGESGALEAYVRALQLGALPAAAERYAQQRIDQLGRNGG